MPLPSVSSDPSEATSPARLRRRLLDRVERRIRDFLAGERTHAVSAGGRFREVVVGRVKVELRPLRLIEARHEDVTVNVFLQDDWHVRVMGDDGAPLNLTTVTPGTGLLGYVVEPGRHVGIKVAEHISEF